MTDAVINDLSYYQSKRVNLTSQASTLRSARAAETFGREHPRINSHGGSVAEIW